MVTHLFIYTDIYVFIYLNMYAFAMELYLLLIIIFLNICFYLFIYYGWGFLLGELYLLDSPGNPREQPPRLQPTQRLRQVGGRCVITSTPGLISQYTHLHEFSDLLCWMGTI